MSTRRHLPADDFDVERELPRDPLAALATLRSRAGRLRVAEAMSQPPTVRPNASLEQLAALFEEEGLHGVAVVDAGAEVLGVVTRTNLLATLVRAVADGRLDAARSTTASDLMTRAPATVSETATMREAAALLADRNVHQLPVLLRSGKLVGMVTTLDVARWLAAES